MLKDTIYPIKSKLVTPTGTVAMVIKYIGSYASGKVLVNSATGDIFTIAGASGSETSSQSALNLGTTTGSIIDVSDASYNTMGEILRGINASSNWKAYLVGAIESDSATYTLAAATWAQAKTDAGVEIKWRAATAVKAFSLAVRIGDLDFPKDDQGSVNRTKYNAMAGKRAQLFGIDAAITATTSSLSTCKIYEVSDQESATLIWQKAGNSTFTMSQQIHPNIESKLGYSLVARYILTAVAGLTTGTFSVVGRTPRVVDFH